VLPVSRVEEAGNTVGRAEAFLEDQLPLMPGMEGVNIPLNVPSLF
jgi:hypothetical protein